MMIEDLKNLAEDERVSGAESKACQSRSSVARE